MRTASRHRWGHAVGPWFPLSLALLVLAGPAPSPHPARAGVPEAQSGAFSDTLTVLFTGETRGNLLPCSCPKDPQGGLARRARFLRDTAEWRERTGTCLRLDAGGFLPEGQVPLRDDPEVAADLVRLLLRGMKRAGIEASVLDNREKAFLRLLAPSESKTLRGVFLEADPPGPPKLLPWGGRTIALLALEESLPDSTIIRAGCLARAQADFLIVLARANAYTGRRLARLARAGLVLLSRGARPTAPLEEGSALLAGCGCDGREVGEIRLLAGPDGRMRLLDFRLHPMDATQPEDAELSRAVTELMRRGGTEELVAGSKE